MKPLPDKPSDLIDLGIDDLEKAERSALHIVNMGVWHEAYSDGCYVCLAGSVMAFSLNGNPKQTLYPQCYSHDMQMKLSALNLFKNGRWEVGVYHMGIMSLTEQQARSLRTIPRPNRYSGFPHQFKATMRSAARTLRSAGL